MERLKAELEKKKAMAEAMRQKVASADGDSVVAGASKEEPKFIRQRDRELLKQQELEEAQRKLDEQREERRRQQLQREEEARTATTKTTSKKSLSSTIPPSVQHPNLREKYAYILQLPLNSIKQRLRQFKEPATVFGESDAERKERLLNLCIEKDLQGWTDDLPSSAVVEQVETVQKDEGESDSDTHAAKKFKTDTSSSSVVHEHKNDSQQDKDEESAGEEEEAGGNRKRHRTENRPANGLYFDPSIQYHKMEDLSPEKVVYKFFRSLVKQWEADLDARPEYEKNTGRGREDARAQHKCKEDIRPLFKMCQRKEVPADILHRLTLMVQYCEEGNFVKANDEYMRTAIGNAAWPMGLTMVGIHERSGREKISTAKIAHIMNNEMERKFLTAVKRLMTFAQTKRPDVPPSMKVQ